MMIGASNGNKEEIRHLDTKDGVKKLDTKELIERLDDYR
jgi:hypothetical protein